MNAINRETVFDVVPPEKRSIRRIALPHGRQPPFVPLPQDEGGGVLPPTEPPPTFPSGGVGRPRRFGVWTIAIVCVIGLGISISHVLGGAKLTVYPRMEKSPVDVTLSLREKAAAGKPSYSIVRAIRTASEVIPAEGEERVERKASGQLVIYNNFSSAPQRLIKNTRFETASGLLYRIDRSVVVPGQRTVEGKTVPGSVEAIVYADVPGENYNLKQSELAGDFTVPGFRGDPRYEKFYARGKTDMTGGFSGLAKTVSKEKLSETRKRLQVKLLNDFRAEVRATLEADSILFDELSLASFESLPSTETLPSGVGVYEQGTLAVFVVKKEQVAAALATSALPNFKKDIPLEILDWSALRAVFENKSIFVGGEGAIVTAHFTGTPTFVWTYSESKLIASLLGQPKGKLPELLREHPGIARAEVVVRPFWKGSLPSNPNRINVTLRRTGGGVVDSPASAGNQ